MWDSGFSIIRWLQAEDSSSIRRFQGGASTELGHLGSCGRPKLGYSNYLVKQSFTRNIIPQQLKVLFFTIEACITSSPCAARLDSVFQTTL